MGEGVRPSEETYNPWTVVNLVFKHLASEGLHPVLGDAGDPGGPAAALLRALGITPAAEGNRQATEQTRRNLAEIRAVIFGESPDASPEVSQADVSEVDVSQVERP